MIQNRFYSVIIHIKLLLAMVLMVWMFLDTSELKTLNNNVQMYGRKCEMIVYLMRVYVKMCFES